MTRSLRTRFARWALGVSVQVKILGIVMSMVLMLGLGFTFYVDHRLRQMGAQELVERGQSIASHLAALSTDLLLTNDLFALHELLRQTLENDPDVRYAFVIDGDGVVVAHTFAGSVPWGLRTLNLALNGERVHDQLFRSEHGPIHDFAAPVLAGQAGLVRVGMSERRLRARLMATTRDLLLAVVLVSCAGVLGAYLLTQVLTRPIHRLVAVTRTVGEGDFAARAPVWADDEIGKLSTAFNAMTESLQRSAAQHDEFSRQIVTQNEELSVINTIATAASQFLDLDQILPAALDDILAWRDLSCGEVFVVDSVRGKAALHSRRCKQGHEHEIEWPLGEGLAQQAARGRDPVVATLTSGPPCELNGAVSIPLLSREEVVGVMNVFGPHPIELAEDEREVLLAVGRQLGIAIENAGLWQELRQKEELRARLLDKLITAQEDERQRVARELHDQTSQSLTSLLVSLSVLNDAASLPEAKATARELQDLVSGTLDEVRRLALELRPPALDDVGLVPALERMAADYGGHDGVEVGFHAGPLAEMSLSPQLETAAYRIVQEALTNVLKHAKAQHASVVLETRDGGLVVLVEDDGMGFEVEETLRQTGGEEPLGLFGMQERATFAGGQCTIESALGRGTTVVVEIPLATSLVSDARGDREALAAAPSLPALESQAA